jgi:hypothetical protein
VQAVTTAGLISVGLNVLSVGFTTWVLRRVHPLVKEIVRARTKLAGANGDLILANGRLVAANDKLIEVNSRLLETQMQLRDALNDVTVQKSMRFLECDALRERLAVAEGKLRAAEARLALRGAILPGGGKVVLDDKTKSLVRLAVDNPEENEGAAAALLVCKRLKERMGG